MVRPIIGEDYANADYNGEKVDLLSAVYAREASLQAAGAAVVSAEVDAPFGAGEQEAGYRAEETSPSADLVREYLQDISKMPLLNAEQEVELSKRIEAGLYAGELLRLADQEGEPLPANATRGELEQLELEGQAAKDHMLNANLRLVVSIAKRYIRSGMPPLDLIQEGNLGLIRAAEKFDYAKGYKFSTYATWWVRQYISRGIAEQGRTIRLPVHQVEAINKIRNTERELLRNLGREPSEQEIADAVGLTPEQLAGYRDYARDTVSLEVSVGNNEDTELGDLVADVDDLGPEEAAMQWARRDAINKALSALPERHARVLALRFGLHDGRPWSLEEVSKEIGVTRERIRQIEKLGLQKLYKLASDIGDFLAA